MISTILLLAALAAQQPAPNGSSSNPRPTSVLTDDLGKKLLQIRRIYVDSFGDDVISKQVQAMLINKLSESKRFVVTENKDKADAVLKGTALEKTSQELHSTSEGTRVRSAAMADSSVSTETISDARVAVRLVDTDGDVVWTSTQESTGAKYKGATADVADKINRQLLRDLEKLEKASDAPSQTVNAQ